MLEWNLFAILLTSIVIAHALHVVHTGNENLLYPRTATIDLGLDPYDRWTTIIRANKVELMEKWASWVDKFNGYGRAKQIKWGSAISDTMDPEHRKELVGIWREMFGQTGDPLIEDEQWLQLLLFQAIYELGSPLMCSEVLAADRNGVMIHGRNLDYTIISPVFEIAFQRNGRTEMVSPVFLAKVGFNTGIKLGSWSFGQNTRQVGPDLDEPPSRQKGSKLFSLFIRELMETPKTFDEVVATFEQQKLVKSMYLIIAGAGRYQGAVITRGPNDSSTQKVRENGPWFLFQTNSDDCSQCIRCTLGKKLMNEMTQANVNPQQIEKVMQTEPILASSNVFLFMMAPKAGTYCTVLGSQSRRFDDVRLDKEQCALRAWSSAQWKVSKTRAWESRLRETRYWDTNQSRIPSPFAQAFSQG